MKILIVSARPPWPPWRGDQLRLVQWLEALAPHHETRLLAPPSPPGAPSPPPSVESLAWKDEPWLQTLSRLGGDLLQGRPAQVALHASEQLSDRLAGIAPDHDRVVLLVRLAPLVESLPGVPGIVDLVDALSVGFSRRARVAPVWQRPFWSLEARRLARMESRVLRQCHRAVVVSSRDRKILERRAPGSASSLRVVPVAFPGDTRKLPELDRPDREEAIAFTGNLGYWVNEDAVVWWGRKVWPRLRNRRPELEWRVAGTRPSRSLQRFLRRREIRLVESPEDLRGELARSRVAIAPLRGGAGQPLKAMDAWAAGVPIVVSPWTAEGLGASDGVRVAASPEEWIESLEELLDSRDLRSRLAREGRRRLRTELSTRRVYGELRAVVEEPSR